MKIYKPHPDGFEAIFDPQPSRPRWIVRHETRSNEFHGWCEKEETAIALVDWLNKKDGLCPTSTP